MNEQEEFEFRARAEKEAQTKPAKPGMFGNRLAVGMAAFNALPNSPATVIQNALKQFGGSIAEKGGQMGYPKTGVALGLPVALFPDLLAAGTSLPEGTASSAALESLANKARTSGSSRWFKALGGTLSNAKELGPEESLRLGRLAREGKYITPFNSAESQAKAIGKGLQSSGKKIEELRSLGDLYGNSPESSKLVQLIHQDLAPKYGAGIHSGESGELKKGIEEVLKLEPIDKLTPTEEMVPRLQGGTKPPKESYEQFRRFQEDPNFIPEYDFRRPTTFNEVAKVATDINKYATGQSKLLQPSGALTDVANVVSKANNEALLKALPPQKGAEYTQNLQKFSDLSKLDRINELKSAHEVGASRNSIVNNIANRIFHRFGYQLSAETMDRIANLISGMNKFPKVNPAGSIGELLKRERQNANPTAQ